MAMISTPQRTCEARPCPPESGIPPMAQAAMPRVPSVPLGDLASKTTVDQLAQFLLDPLKTRPHGRMPASAPAAISAPHNGSATS